MTDWRNHWLLGTGWKRSLVSFAAVIPAGVTLSVVQHRFDLTEAQMFLVAAPVVFVFTAIGCFTFFGPFDWSKARWKR